MDLETDRPTSIGISASRGNPKSTVSSPVGRITPRKRPRMSSRQLQSMASESLGQVSFFIDCDGTYGSIAADGNKRENELALRIGLESSELSHDTACRLRPCRYLEILKKRRSVQMDGEDITEIVGRLRSDYVFRAKSQSGNIDSVFGNWQLIYEVAESLIRESTRICNCRLVCKLVMMDPAPKIPV
jgi:hypothetical protein